MEAEHVFKALADHHRRHLLDLLFSRDGQTLIELCAHLPMTRYGVMKHLQVLEDAQLITTRKVGREKFHYLNPVPIQQVYDRWVSKYAQPFTNSLLQFKQELENPPMADTSTHVYMIYIRSTPEAIWHALTDAEASKKYSFFETSVVSTWEKGAPYSYNLPSGGAMLEGEVLEVDPPHKLVTTFRPLWEGITPADYAVITYEIEQVGDVCKVSVTHFNPNGEIHPGYIDAWAQQFSAIKSLLETGEALPIPQ
jgi:uncharacterized protein YndB with AHSA1/START domain/DNA-binding transcriptional ArsR family regulator